MKKPLILLISIMLSANLLGGNPIKDIVERFPWYGGHGVEYVAITYSGDSVLMFPDRSIDESLESLPINKAKYWEALISLKEESRILCDSSLIKNDTLASRILGLETPQKNVFMATKVQPKKHSIKIDLTNGNCVLLFPLDGSDTKNWIILWENSIHEASGGAIRRFMEMSKSEKPDDAIISF